MKKTFKYKLIPLGMTEETAFQWLNLCRQLYNCALEQRIYSYKDGGKVSYVNQANELKAIKEQFPEYRTIFSQVLQDVLRRLDKSYQNFFYRVKERNSKAGFPRFKGKNWYRSFTYPQSGFRVIDNHLVCSKLGEFKIRFHRPIEGRIKTCTIIYRSTGEWFVCFSCDNVPETKLPEIGKKVGIDLGLSHFAVDSDGRVTDAPKFFRRQERYLRRCQRALARKKKSSKNRERARIKVAKIHQKIQNQRLDFAHKLATYYIRNYDHVCVEDLRIKNMVRNSRLSKSLHDAALGIFLSVLSCKAENAGRLLEKKDPRCTSITCSRCGHVQKILLSQRVFLCEKCEYQECRDKNAAKNIKNKPARSMPVSVKRAAVMAACSEAQVF